MQKQQRDSYEKSDLRLNVKKRSEIYHSIIDNTSCAEHTKVQ